MLTEFEELFGSACDAKDVPAMSKLPEQFTFTSRVWADGDHFVTPRSVLTYIDRLDRTITGIRHHYDVMSEMAHPNALGHFLFFGDMDHATATASFSDDGPNLGGILANLIVAFIAIDWIANRLERLEARWPAIAAIHEEYIAAARQ
jgi:hypothetical protein